MNTETGEGNIQVTNLSDWKSGTKWSLQKFDFFFINIGGGQENTPRCRGTEAGQALQAAIFFFKLHEYHHINIFICEGSVILCRRVLMNKYTASKADLHWNSRSISTWAPAPSYLATIANQESNSENYRLLRGGIRGLSSAVRWLDSNLRGPSNIYSSKGQRDEKRETMPGWEPR